MRLSAIDLACRRGGRDVFAGVGFSVASGELLTVSGRNGAGKSSLLRIIVGLIRIAHGRLALEGGDPELTVAEQAHYLGHLDALKPSLSVAENLRFWAGFFGAPAGDVGQPLEAVGLDALAELPAAYLSAGQRRRLSIARLLAVKRPIWLLDEPTSTLDVAARDHLAGFMRAHLAAGGLIIASTHGSLGLSSTQELRLGHSSSSPPVGEGRGRSAGGGAPTSAEAVHLTTPTTDPSPPEPAPGRTQARPGWGGEKKTP